jgi:hypothetical protein
VGLVSYFGGKFFTPLDKSSGPVLGQIAWVPVPNLNPQPMVVEAERTSDTSHQQVRARFVTLNDNHFTRRDLKELPILNFKLGETEEMIAFKAKRRPGIIVGVGATVLGGLDAHARAHHEEGRIVVAPAYGVRSEDDPSGFSSVMAARVRHLLYRQYFPLAEWKETRSSRTVPGACSLQEGIVRFDRIQFVSPSPPGCRFAPVRLADDVLVLLHAMLWAYLHAEPSKALVEMREILADCLPDEAKPKGAVKP